MSSSVPAASTGEKFVPEEDNFLQKHAAFFDRNKDGIIYPSETFQGLRAIGGGFLFSAFTSVLVNMSFSKQTRPGKGFSWSFPVEVKNIHLAKHGSDTGAFDKDGRFVASKFEDIFAKHAKTHTDALTYDEVKQLLKAQKEPKDYGGQITAYAEWYIFYQLCKDKNGLLPKDTVRGVYDGSLFEKLEKQRASKKDP